MSGHGRRNGRHVLKGFGHQGAIAYNGDPRGAKPFRDKGVRMKGVVPCPTCGAGVDDPCVSAGGKHVVHESRRRMALRAQREAQDG